MKKLIAMFLALALCLSVASAAMAEDIPSFYWADNVEDVAEIEGGFYTLNALGLKVWVPEVMQLQDVSDEESARGIYALFTNDSHTASLTVNVTESDMTYDGYCDYVREHDIEPHMAYINDLPVVVYHYVRGENDESDCVALVTNEGEIIDFVFTGEDADFVWFKDYIAYSIQLADDEEAEETPAYFWEDTEAELEASGVTGDFYKMGSANVIAWIPSFLELRELDDDEIDGGRIAFFQNEDGTNYVSVVLADMGLTYNEFLDKLIDRGAEDITEIVANGLPLVLYTYTNGDGQSFNSVTLVMDDGYILNLDCTSGDEDFDNYFSPIVTSIQVIAD